MRDYDKNKESSWDVKNLHGWVMSQKLAVQKFNCIEDTSQFNENFIKKLRWISDERYFLEVDVQCLQKLHELHNDLPFLPERMKLGKIKKLLANLHGKTEYLIHIRTNIKLWINFEKRS